MTGWIPDVVPDAVVASSWGNTIRDRTVTPFDNVAARTAAITAPKQGMVTWLADVERLEVWDGEAWRPIGPHTDGARRVPFAAVNAISNPATYQPLAAGADRTALTLTFQKYAADTVLALHFVGQWACSSGVAAQRWQQGLRMAGPTNADIDMTMVYPTGWGITAPFRLTAQAGNAIVTGLAAGAYTFQPIVKCSTGAAVINYYNLDDYIAYTVTETYQ